MMQRVRSLITLFIVFTVQQSTAGLSPPTIAKNLQSGSSLASGDLLVLGIGRVGLKVAELATSGNASIVNRVTGTVRRHPYVGSSDNNKSDFNARIRRVQFDDCELLSIVPMCRYVLVTIPPPIESKLEEEQLSGDEFYFNLQKIIQKINPGCWIGLISTTGVYGNHDGDWITEESECKCRHDSNAFSSASRFLKYESQWKTLAAEGGHTLRIFRCAGIYSNDQSALHTVYRNGIEVSRHINKNESKDKNDITNRIHVHDIARAVVYSMKQYNLHHSQPGYDSFRIFNLADNLPESREVVMAHAASLLKSIGVEVIVKRSITNNDGTSSSVDVELGATNRSTRRFTDRKRVSNQRMLQELFQDSVLSFPTYKEGLLHILNDRKNAWWKLHEE